jgi:hypothetical protein
VLLLLSTLRCCQAAAAALIASVLIVIVLTISVPVASAAFSGLLIVVCAPTIAVANGVFIPTVAACDSSAAPAALLPLLMPQCH